MRNREMAKEGEYLVAIPDAKSRGTLDMIAAMREVGTPESNIFIASFKDQKNQGEPNTK
jgi:hypothetical protein